MRIRAFCVLGVLVCQGAWGISFIHPDIVDWNAYVRSSAAVGARYGGSQGLTQFGMPSALNVARSAAVTTAVPAVTTAVALTRGLTMAGIATAVAPYAKAVGPWAVGMAAASWAFDYALDNWTKPPVTTTVNCTGKCSLPGEWCRVFTGSIYVYGFAQIRSSSQSTCPSRPVSAAPYVSAGSCTVYPAECGYFPVVGVVPANMGQNVPVTDAERKQKVQDLMTTNAKALEFIQGAEPLGLTEAEVTAGAGPVVTSGPATGQTLSSTTTNVVGGVTTVTTVTNQPTYNYAGDTINVTNIQTTTTTGPNGTTVDTTTDSGDWQYQNPPPVIVQVEGDFPEPIDVCVEHPDAAMCQPLGAAPVPDVIPTQAVDVTFSKEMTASGSCPADVSLSALGHPITWSWGQVCGFAEGIRPIVLLVNMLAAGTMIFMVVRRGVA